MRAPSGRVKRVPRKFSSYWDMNIPTEYYEEDFLEFEKKFESKNKGNPNEFSKVPGESYGILQEFQKLEKKLKAKQSIKSECKGMARTDAKEHKLVVANSEQKIEEQEVCIYFKSKYTR